MRSTSTLAAAVLLCSSLSLCYGREEEPPPSAAASSWMLERRIERIRGEHGEEEVLNTIRDELREVLYSAPDLESWYRMMLEYLAEHGNADSLALLDKWLALDFRPSVNKMYWEIRYTRPLASRAWYRIRERQCDTRAERLALACEILDPAPDTPRLAITPDFAQEVFSALYPDTRAKVLAVLLDPRREYLASARATRDVLYALLRLPEFAPTQGEKQRILADGGSLGKQVVLDLDAEDPEVEARWESLRKNGDLRTRAKAYEHFAFRDLRRAQFNTAAVRGAIGLNDYLRFLRQLQDEPLSETVEELKHDGMSFLRSNTRCFLDVPDVLDFLATFLHTGALHSS